MSIVQTFRGGPLDGSTMDTGLATPEGLPDMIVLGGPGGFVYQRTAVEEAGSTGVTVAVYEPRDEAAPPRDDTKPDSATIAEQPCDACARPDRCDGYDLVDDHRERCPEDATGIAFVTRGELTACVQLCERHGHLLPGRS